MKEFRNHFENPPSFYRSFPFWGWNADLKKEEVIEQIRGMKQAGVGGFFIHSRDGLETEYMGGQWMACVKAAVEEAGRQDMLVWLYDEDRWPSGTAGGKVTAKGDACRCKGLTLEICGAHKLADLVKNEGKGRAGLIVDDSSTGILALYGAVIHDMEAKSYHRLPLDGSVPPGEGELLLVIRLEVSAPSAWFNQEAPPDNLNPDCVKQFLQETHESYAREIGERFGTIVAGIFTDEPSMHDRHSYFGENKAWIPWTFGFQSYFEEKRGYDFFNLLPAFYFHHADSRKARHDYWHTLTKRYSETFFRTIGEWCEANGIRFTGHLLQEDKMGLCTRVNGAAMPHYRYMHVPGIDMLCEQTGEYMTVKQCSSVAHQLGRKQVLSETYGCTGWDFSFEGQKWMGDWQYVLGVSRRCQHIAQYSLRGCRKRDYPPSFNYNNTWWEKYKTVEDYFGRLSVAMEEGTPIRRVLLLHPSTTVWSRFGVNPWGNPVRRKERDLPAENSYGDTCNELIKWLVKQHYDCDLGDEIMIEELGKPDGQSFVIGQGVYDIVIFPGMDTMLKDTCEKMLAYVKQGGKAVFIKPVPFLIEGDMPRSEALNELLSHVNVRTVDDKEALSELLEDYRTVSIEDVEGQQHTGVLYQLRSCDDGQLLFVTNNHRTEKADIKITLPGTGHVEELELMTGEVHDRVQAVSEGGETVIRVCLDGTGSRLYFIRTKNRDTCFPADQRGGEAVPTVAQEGMEELPEECPVTLSSQNVLTLDRCRSRLPGEAISEEMEVWQIQYAVREKLGMTQIHVNGLEQRYKWIHKKHPSDNATLELFFRFYAEEALSGIKLVMEQPERFTISCNQEQVATMENSTAADTKGTSAATGAADSTDISGNTEASGTSWFLDKALRVLALPAVKKGENLISLTCRYTRDMELENLYLLGSFGVTPDRRLVKMADKLRTGDWCGQGLKHYCGSVIYHYKYVYTGNAKADRPDKVWIRIPEISAVCMTLCINGSGLSVPWQMEERIEITPYIRQGMNDIDIEVTGSPVNMMGPFHLKEGKPYNTHDSCFCPEQGEYTEEYFLKPYGILKRVRILKEIPSGDVRT